MHQEVLHKNVQIIHLLGNLLILALSQFQHLILLQLSLPVNFQNKNRKIKQTNEHEFNFHWKLKPLVIGEDLGKHLNKS